MIDKRLSINLPLPWVDQRFETNYIGAINFLVGPNGSGKSRFAKELANHLENTRQLGTDRLSGMEQIRPFVPFIGDPFAEGLAKNQFGQLKQEGTAGFGIDTIVLLEERMDLRIRVEATISHLFGREITLEWDSGNLVARARLLRDNASYRLDRDECHGIKELLVLLTHLYDNQHQCLIIDEPELNFHPQYQAFFMQEVRKIAGSSGPTESKKTVFLITHSPFILDLQTEDDLNSVISFDLNYSTPTQVATLDLDVLPSKSFIRRLNAHHKQLFFSDNPVFVEGILDAWLVEAMMDARGVSVAGAGSCIIDAGGVEQVNEYLRMCHGLGKDAHFLYDLDSLFKGTLRACIAEDESIKHFLASAGLGTDFGRYFGQLERELTSLVDQLLASSLPANLAQLGAFLGTLGDRCQWKQQEWAKARTAVMTAISRYRENVVSVSSSQVVESIEGRLDQILSALHKKNVHVLPGGTLERYLPHYQGDEYELTPSAKRDAVNKEMEEMTSITTTAALAKRYGELYAEVCSLPSESTVDVDAVLRNYLGDYIHQLQSTIVNHPDWDQDQIQSHLNRTQRAVVNVFSIEAFERQRDREFRATIGISGMIGKGRRVVYVSHQTNAGMGDFEIECAQTLSESTP